MNQQVDHTPNWYEFVQKLQKVTNRATQKKGVTQYKICQESGCDTGAMSRFCSGKQKKPSLDFLVTIGKVFGYKLAWVHENHRYRLSAAGLSLILSTILICHLAMPSTQPQAAPVAAVIPSVWAQQFGQEPSELIPGEDKNWYISGNKIQVATDVRPVLVKLGDLDSSSYEIQMKIRPLNLSGRFGLFFNAQETEDAASVSVVIFRQGFRKPTLLRCSKLTANRDGVISQSLLLSTEDINSESDFYDLRLSVTNGKVSRIFLNGKDFSKNLLKTDIIARGSFGIIGENCICDFSHPVIERT